MPWLFQKFAKIFWCFCKFLKEQRNIPLNAEINNGYDPLSKAKEMMVLEFHLTVCGTFGEAKHMVVGQGFRQVILSEAKKVVIASFSEAKVVIVSSALGKS